MRKDEVMTKEKLRRKPRILVAEDEMIIAADLEDILTGLGYDSAGIFMSGEETLQGIDEARPDLVLMDIRLQGELDGLATAAQIRERHDIPVVYLTGYAEEAVLQAATLTDPFGYVGKPVREGELRATIEMALYRHEMDQKLRESEEQHRTLFETMAQGVVYQATDGQIVSANPAAERILGLTLDQMQGRTSTDPRWRAIHEDGSPFSGDTHPSMLALKSGKEVHDVVMGVFNPLYEEYRWININATPQFRPGESTPYRVFTTFDDITERKRAEEALRESRNWFSTTLKSIGDAVIATDLAGHVRLMNSVAQALTGWDEREAAGHPLEEVFHIVNEQTGERVENPVTRVVQEGVVVGLANHTALIARDGGRSFIADSGAPIRDGQGEITGVVLVFRDITEQVRTEGEIESLARFPSENRSPVLRVAQDGTILYANEGSTPLLDLWAAQADGKLPDDWQKFAGDVLERDAACTSEVVCGDSIFSLDFAPVKEEDYVNVYGRDITERKQAEEQIKANLAEKEVLLREIHHRVKNSLQVISSLLTFQSDALENEEAALAFQESRNRIQAMARVHEHLYRSEDLAQIDMVNYISELVGYLRQTHWAYGVIPRVEVADVRLDVDTAMPCGLLINELVSNAMKHAFPTQEEVGPDELRGEILIALQAEGNELVLTVGDDGVGLPVDVDMETTASLGLRLVEMLTRQLRGTLELDRGVESGTCFRITFPAPV